MERGIFPTQEPWIPSFKQMLWACRSDPLPLFEEWVLPFDWWLHKGLKWANALQYNAFTPEDPLPSHFLCSILIIWVTALQTELGTCWICYRKGDIICLKSCRTGQDVLRGTQRVTQHWILSVLVQSKSKWRHQGIKQDKRKFTDM